MKFLPLLFANFRRHRLRTALTILSIMIAFVLFGYLAAIRNAFSFGVSVAGQDRLIVRHKVSLIQLLPENYEAQIEKIDGIKDATHATWFGGIYQDPKNFFGQMAVKPVEFLDMYTEFKLPPAQKEAWLATRTGAIVGRTTADRFGFKVGQKIPIQATFWRPKTGGNTWTFDLAGIYEGSKTTDTSNFFFRYDYLDEMKMNTRGMVGWYYIKVKDPKRAAQIAAKVDDTFANSPYETKTETEGAFVKSFADQVGNIGAIIRAILTAVFFTILLVAGNTMAQAVRERVGEFGVMKAIGFTDAQVLTFVLLESCLIAIIGGAIGLTLGWLAVARGDPTKGALPVFIFPERDVVIGIVLVLTLGIITGLVPALQAMRLNTVEALRRE